MAHRTTLIPGDGIGSDTARAAVRILVESTHGFTEALSGKL